MTDYPHSTAGEEQPTTYRFDLEKKPWSQAVMTIVALVGLLFPFVPMIGAVAAWTTGRTEQSKTLGLCAMGAWIINIFIILTMR